MSNYNIGQYRYTGSDCMYAVSASAGYKTVVMGDGFLDEDAASTYFRDVSITPSTPLKPKKDYYLSISIPRDLNYDMSFNIKLINSAENTGTTSQNYQFIKNVSITRGGTGENVYGVVLYEATDGSIKVAIPEPYNRNNPSVLDALYYDNIYDRYYIGLGGAKYQLTYKYNDVSIVASWREDTEVTLVNFDMIFRPLEQFDTILIEMVRSAEDYNIQRLNGDAIEYGRIVSLANLNFTLAELNNLVQYMNKDGVLSRIGVWSHSGLLMAINGEEIRVGRSGLYEIDVIDISSIGIVAPDNNFTNNFTIDYEYLVSSTT